MLLLSVSPSTRYIRDVTADPVQSLENVLQNINKLNRSLEGVIAVRIPHLTQPYYNWS